MRVTGQFILVVHVAGTIRNFQEFVKDRLLNGEMVYATLDLGMPLDDGETPTEENGLKMLSWCLELPEQYPDRPNLSRSFEFCIISDKENLLDELSRGTRFLEHFRRRKIRKVSKTVGDGIEVMIPDIREFAMRHIHFATFPSVTYKNEHQSIWFDPRETPARLLVIANKIAMEKKEGGLHLLFADTAGYEEDWFRLFCHLRGVDPVVKDFWQQSETPPENWDLAFANPPPAIFINHMEYAKAGVFDAEQLILKSGLLAAAAAERCFVFLCFPFLETQLDYDTLKGKYSGVLYRILAEALIQAGHPNPQQGIGFAFEIGTRHRLIPFPCYENVLKKELVLKKTIEFETQQHKERSGVVADLDPELVEFLAEYPWNEHKTGLVGLHLNLWRGYKEFGEKHPPGSTKSPAFVTESYLPDAINIRMEFDRELGFRVRTRWLYQHLRERGPRNLTESDSSDKSAAQAALAALEEILDLFRRIKRWGDLRQALDNLKETGAVNLKVFLMPEAIGLNIVLGFLNSVFEDPETLERKIDHFRPHINSDRWQSMFPGLDRHSNDWLKVFEGIKITWPPELPHHRSIITYLAHSKLDYRVLTDWDDVLERNLDLKKEYDALNLARTKLIMDLSNREAKRFAAIKAMYHADMPPVATFLQEDTKAPSAGSYTKVLRSLLHFQAFLALCENYYMFSGSDELCSKGTAKQMIDLPALGTAQTLLTNYVEKLGKVKDAATGESRLSKSILHKWHRKWATEKWLIDGGPSDAVRVVVGIVQELHEKFPQRFPSAPEDKDDLFNVIARKKPGGESFLIGEFLEFAVALRNRFSKEASEGADASGDSDDQWSSIAPETWNLLRQFVASVSVPMRIGIVEEGRVRSWQSTRGHAPSEELPPIPDGASGEIWVYAPSSIGNPEGKPVFVPAFRIDSVIRIRPDDGVMFGVYNKKEWRALVATANDAELAFGSCDWLPTYKAWRANPVIAHYLT